MCGNVSVLAEMHSAHTSAKAHVNMWVQPVELVRYSTHTCSNVLSDKGRGAMMPTRMMVREMGECALMPTWGDCTEDWIYSPSPHCNTPPSHTHTHPPALPADATKMIPALFTTSEATSTTRPTSGRAAGSPYDMLICTHSGSIAHRGYRQTHTESVRATITASDRVYPLNRGVGLEKGALVWWSQRAPGLLRHSGEQ